MKESDPVSLYPEFLRDTSPQSLDGFSSGDIELHGAAGGRGDGQKHVCKEEAARADA